jgi:hypothetical protein
LLFIASNSGHSSLGDTTNELLDQHHIKISRQAFDERFDESAVAFVKSLFEEFFSRQMDATIEKDFLKSFKSVRIKDGTRIELPLRLKEYFKGFGGNKASASGMCIQYEFDIKTWKVLDLDIIDAKSSDCSDAKAKIDDIKEGELIIRDLGYFSLEVIREIIKRKAFIISRLNTSTLVYDKNGLELSFVALYKKMIKSNNRHLEKQVFIGRDHRIPIRLVIDIVPEDIYQSRIKKINAYNKRKGFTTTEQYKTRCRFNLFVTNVDSQVITSYQVTDLYKLRWQIEIMFKIWKSICGLDKLKPMKYHRFICIIYTKLLMFQINNHVFNRLNHIFFKKDNKLLSMFKCHKTLMKYFGKFRKILGQKNKKWKQYMDEITNLISRNHWLEKKRNKLSFLEIFLLFTCKSNIYRYI